ncbi:MAG: hypothetical protein ACRDUA_07510 [Micromonosporaceae bacterium]
MDQQNAPTDPPRRRIPRLPVFLSALAIGLGAFFTPGWIGVVLVGLLAAAVTVLLVVTWSQQPVAARALRLLVLGVLVVIAANKVL